MGKINALTHGFNSGTASRGALNRIDKEALRLYAERQENLLPYSIGRAIMRPGTEFLEASYNGTRPRLIPFVKGLDDVALIEMIAGFMRVWIDDEPLSRDAVTATVTSGDFSSGTGWATTVTGGATATISGGLLTLAAPARGGKALATQTITINELGMEHALRVIVSDGPVTLRVGGLAGGDEYLSEASLDTGQHSLTFTPTGVTGLDAFTVLLLHGDGVDGSTTITDSSASAHTVVVNFDTQVDTAQQKFGTGSILFDGNNDFLNLNEESDFTFGDGDFTIDMWVRRVTTGDVEFIYDGRSAGITTDSRPTLFFDTDDKIYYRFGSTTISGTTTVGTGTWNHIAVARSGTTTRLFLNGVLQGSATDSTVYTGASNRPRLGKAGTTDSNNFDFGGWMDEIRVSKGIARWTASFTPPTTAYGSTPGNSAFIQLFSQLERQVIVDSIQIESSGDVVFSAPWNEDDLREIRTDQSGDVIFMANGNWRQRKIERRTTRSWSLVEYAAEDGPFTLSRTASVRIKASATRGNITLTSDAAFFRPEFVGALVRLDHERFHRTFALAAEETATDAWRVRGIGTENAWDFVISGTWVGTIREQRSFDGAESGFVDINSYAANTSVTTDPAVAYDNQIFYQRYAFKSGEYTSGSATIEVTYGGFGAGGVARITAYVSSTSVSAEILDDFNDVVYTKSWLEGDWSDRRGWPEAVGFFDGRLWWARRDKFWGSESDDYYAFNLDTEGDSGSIQRSIAAGGQINQTQWIMGLQRLILGTNAAPMSVRSSSFDEPLTPTNITLKPASPVGSARVSPVCVGSRGAFVGVDGRKLYELAYNVDAQDYVANDLTRLNEDVADASNPALFDDAIVELAYQNSPEPYLWALRDDGILVPCVFNPSEDARGFFRVITGATDQLNAQRIADRIVSIAVLPRSIEDDVYIAVERTIGNGLGGTTTSHYIEKFAQHRSTIARSFNATTKEVEVQNGLILADSHVTTTGASIVGQIITGLSHLEGRDVIVIGQTVGGGHGPVTDADGEVALHTVASGSIATTVALSGTICAGLGYEGIYKSAKLAYAAQGGTALTQRKQVTQLGLALIDTHPDALRVGPDLDDDDEMDELPRIDSDGAERGMTTTFLRASEEEPFPFPGTWDTDARVCIKVRPGYSACLSALVVGVETKER